MLWNDPFKIKLQALDKGSLLGTRSSLTLRDLICRQCLHSCHSTRGGEPGQGFSFPNQDLEKGNGRFPAHPVWANFRFGEEKKKGSWFQYFNELLGERDEGRLIMEEGKGEEKRWWCYQQENNQFFLLKYLFFFSHTDKNSFKIVLDSRSWTLIPSAPSSSGYSGRF